MRLLPGGGWPVGAITELMPEAQGIGELSLLLPALAQLSRAGRYLAWIAPPCLPYPPALAQHGLRARAAAAGAGARCARRAVGRRAGAALPGHRRGARLAGALDERRVRRLQLAAEAGGSCGLAVPAAAARRGSPRRAACDCGSRRCSAGLHVEIHKARGGRAHALVVHPAAAVCA